MGSVHALMLPTTFSRGAESAEDDQQLFEATSKGDPTGLTIAFAAEVAAQAGQMSHERKRRVQGASAKAGGRLRMKESYRVRPCQSPWPRVMRVVG